MPASGAHALPALRRRSFVGGALGLSAGLGACGGDHDGRLRLRIATDVGPTHLLTQTLTEFAQELDVLFPGRLHVEVFHSGQLYNDRDLARAVLRNDIDMAAPTITTLSRIVADCGLTSLPAFFGRPATATHQVLDGPVGAAILHRLERALGVKVLAPHVDLGHISLFLSGRRRARDGFFAGLKTRIPSGAANVLRVRASGGYPIMMPWADVPSALAQGAVDAVESTNETIRSGRLWDAGITTSIQHRPMFLQYVPLVGRRFWTDAPAEMKQTVAEIWRVIGLKARTRSAERQRAAREACEHNGVRVSDPTPEDTARARQRLTPLTPRIAARLGVDPALVAAAERILESAPE